MTDKDIAGLRELQRVTDALRDMQLNWTRFYRELPDGEYQNLGEMRQASVHAGKALIGEDYGAPEGFNQAMGTAALASPAEERLSEKELHDTAAYITLRLPQDLRWGGDRTEEGKIIKRLLAAALASPAGEQGEIKYTGPAGKLMQVHAPQPSAPPAGELLFDLVAETRKKLRPYLMIEPFKTGTIPLQDLYVDIILQDALEAGRQAGLEEGAKICDAAYPHLAAAIRALAAQGKGESDD